MSDEFKDEDFENESDKTAFQKIKEWSKENLRIIVSILIVALIASSIYSYSKRGEKMAEQNGKNKNAEIEKILDDISSQNKKQDQAKNEKNEDNSAKKTVSDKAATSEKNEQDKTDSEKQDEVTKNKEAQQQDNEVIEPESENNQTKQAVTKKETEQGGSAKETENSFIESAAPGDGLTNLARKALAHYLEKNPDSSLTPEHKIYIEDYLRKNVNHHGRIYTGTTVEFSKSLIKDAINASKNLNGAQLKNLHKYAVKVRF